MNKLLVQKIFVLHTCCKDASQKESCKFNRNIFITLKPALQSPNRRGTKEQDPNVLKLYFEDGYANFEAVLGFISF